METPPQIAAPAAPVERNLDNLSQDLLLSRGRPLLVMYYPDDYGQIRSDDLKKLYEEFRKKGFKRDSNRIPELDVLIHTYGGHPDAGYMLGRIIREFGEKVNFLVPYHSTSAGTITCFSGNNILFGAHAYLSPIDLYINGKRLLAIDGFIDFAVECRRKTDLMLKFDRLTRGRSDVEVKMLDKLVDSFEDPMVIGEFFKNRHLTGYYARILLQDYMFANDPNKVDISNDIVGNVLFNFPTHDFYLDYYLCKKLGLLVESMSEDQSDMSRQIIDELESYEKREIICKKIQEGENYYRTSFIRLYV